MKTERVTCDTCGKDTDGEYYEFGMHARSKTGAVYYVGPPSEKGILMGPRNLVGTHQFCKLSCAAGYYNLDQEPNESKPN